MTDAAKSESRRDLVLRMAARRFAERGIAVTTMRDIGAATDMLPGSLYHYFSSKDALVSEVLERFMADIDARIGAVAGIEGDPVTKLGALVDATMAIIADHPDETAMYQDDQKYLREHGLLGPVEKIADKVHATWLEVISAGIRAGHLRADLTPDLIYRPIRETMWASRNWPDREMYSTQELARILVSIFLDGSAVRRR